MNLAFILAALAAAQADPSDPQSVTPPAEGAAAAAGQAPPPTATLTDLEVVAAVVWERLIDYSWRAIGALALLIAAFIIGRWARRTVYRGLSRVKVDETLKRFLSNLAKWAIIVVAVVACLGTLGVATTSFAAVIGAAGLAIALGFQGSLSNLAAGVMILLFRPFKVGDMILVGGQMGKVDDIELFSTKLDTPDNRRLVVPNSQLFNALIENITHHPRRRVDIPVGVSYSADIDETRRALESALAEIPDALTDPAPQIFLKGFGASSVDWDVRVWAPAAKFGDVRQATVRATKRALDRAGITIPFPQMDVHLFPYGPVPVQAAKTPAGELAS